MRRHLFRRFKWTSEGREPVPNDLNPEVWDILDEGVPYFRAKPKRRVRPDDLGRWSFLRPDSLEAAPDRGPEWAWIGLGDGEIRGWLADRGISKARWEALDDEYRHRVVMALRALRSFEGSVVTYLAFLAPAARVPAESADRARLERLLDSVALAFDSDVKNRDGYFPAKSRRRNGPWALALLPVLQAEVEEIFREADRANGAMFDTSVWNDQAWLAKVARRLHSFLRAHNVDWPPIAGPPEAGWRLVSKLDLGDSAEASRQIVMQVFPGVRRELLIRGKKKKRTKKAATKAE